MSKLLHNLFFSVEFKQKGALVFRLAMLLSHLLPSPEFLLLYLLYFININRGNIMYIPISYHFGIKIHLSTTVVLGYSFGVLRTLFRKLV